MEGVQEKEIGVVNKTPNSRCYVSLVRMPYGDTYIVVSNQFRTKTAKVGITKDRLGFRFIQQVKFQHSLAKPYEKDGN